MKRAIWIEYELKLKDGTPIEKATLGFVPGRDQILPALEKRIVSMAVGEVAIGILRSEEAFGDVSLLPTAEIARTEFPPDAHVEVGHLFEARAADGENVKFEVLEVGESLVKVRFLHPLAEHDIEYRLRVIEPPLKAPPPVPGHALGIDSAAIQLDVEDRAFN
jgi:FKBP-type peptidyl-prolyl cis-trans isomerase 2